MREVLNQVRRCAYQGRVRFTFQAKAQRISDGLRTEDIIEALVYAQHARYKVSTSRFRRGREYVYIIESFTLDGVLVYTKGVFRVDGSGEEYFLLVSAKRSRRT